MKINTTQAKEALRTAGFTDLADAAERFDRELGCTATAVIPFLLHDVPLLTQLCAHLPKAATIAKRLSEVFGEAEDQSRCELETVLVRALAPNQAMVTVPHEKLFATGELPAVPCPAESHTPLPHVDLRQHVGQPLDYTGYLCMILKVTRLCNLRCAYCNDNEGSPQSTVTPGFLSNVLEQSLSGPRGALDIVLHGGEPLMMGRKRFLQLLWLAAAYTRPGQLVRIHLQTNGTLIEERWVRLLQLFGIKASVSLDGPAELHDEVRKDVKGRPTSARALGGLRKLQDADLLSGTLMVVGEDMLRIGAERVHAFLQDSNINSVCFLPVRPQAHSRSSMPVGRFVDFLIDLFAKDK